MNWHAALFGFLFTIGVVVGGFVLVGSVMWAGETFGPIGAAVAMVLLLAAAVGIGMGASER